MVKREQGPYNKVAKIDDSPGHARTATKDGEDKKP